MYNLEHDRNQLRFCVEYDKRCYHVVDRALYRRIATYSYKRQSESHSAFRRAADDMLARNAEQYAKLNQHQPLETRP